MSDLDTERGLYRKYQVERLHDPTGKHDECDYFVLDIKHDVFARKALSAYAEACHATYPDLASDLRRWLIDVEDRLPSLLPELPYEREMR